MDGSDGVRDSPVIYLHPPKIVDVISHMTSMLMVRKQYLSTCAGASVSLKGLQEAAEGDMAKPLKRAPLWRYALPRSQLPKTMSAG